MLRLRYPRIALVFYMAWVFYDGNFYFLAYYFIHNYTNLCNRNPNLGVEQAMGVFGGVRAAYMCYTLCRRGRETFPIGQSAINSTYRMGMTLGILVLAPCSRFTVRSTRVAIAYFFLAFSLSPR
jgi:hypothetical protein